jgi:hypothetical protein
MEKGKIEALVKADYFERKAERMRYPKFRGLGLFASSDVVIGARLNAPACSGQFPAPMPSSPSAAAA